MARRRVSWQTPVIGRGALSRAVQRAREEQARDADRGDGCLGHGAGRPLSQLGDSRPPPLPIGVAHAARALLVRRRAEKGARQAREDMVVEEVPPKYGK